MSEGAPYVPVAAAKNSAAGFWSRFRITFGPALVGLVGGGLTFGIALVTMSTLLKNVGNTYAQYPSLQTPWLAGAVSMPSVLRVPLLILGFAGPLAMGLATAWLVRSRDRWAEVTAGLTTALTSSLAAYMVGLGWSVTLALVVVPSISDLTLLGNATQAPAQANGHPSDVLAERYPDLRDVPANERGGQFFAKVISDQVIGSAYTVWLGIGMSLGTVGLVGFCSTLAGGWLLRRGGSWHSILVGYGELTVSTAWAAKQLLFLALGIGGSSWFSASCLVLATVFVVTGVVRRWHWLLRLEVALLWILVLAQAELVGTPWPAWAACLVYSIVGCLLLRQWALRRPRPALATA
jgi:hypothetical protein